MVIKIGKFRIRPEIEKPLYWVHIAIISVILLLILKFVFNHDMLSFAMFWKVGVAIAFADITIHTILKLD